MITWFEKMILTYWIKWSKIFDKNYNIIEVEWVENPDFVDATWAWDAYRAWLLKWLTDWYDWLTSARIWAVLASLSTQAYGAQNYYIDWKQFKTLYEQTFGDEL
jgi:sugar/nucleoside kinase (ribokinase family)